MTERPLANRIAVVTGASRGIGRAVAIELPRAGAHVIALGPRQGDHMRAGPLTPLAHLEPKQWDNVVAVNVTANLRLIRSLDHPLRASDAGRVVMLSSGAAHRAAMKAYWGPYAITKGAVDSMVRTYAAETEEMTPVKVMAVNPGPIRTMMRKQAMPGEDPSTLTTPEAVAPKIVALCLPSWTETGKLYDVSTDSVQVFQGPAAA